MRLLVKAAFAARPRARLFNSGQSGMCCITALLRREVLYQPILSCGYQPQYGQSMRTNPMNSPFRP